MLLTGVDATTTTDLVDQLLQLLLHLQDGVGGLNVQEHGHLFSLDSNVHAASHLAALVVPLLLGECECELPLLLCQ